MGVQQKWDQYAYETVFNFSVLPEEIQRKGKELTFQPKQLVGKLMEAFQRMIWRLRAAGESLDARERQLGFQKMIEVALETV